MRLSKLSLRIYVALLVQAAVIAVALYVFHRLTFSASGGPIRHDARRAAELVERMFESEAPDVLADEIYQHASGFVTVYDGRGELLFNTAHPPLPAMGAAELSEVMREGERGGDVSTHGEPALVDVALSGGRYMRMRPFRPPPPPRVASLGLFTAALVSALTALYLARTLARPLKKLEQAAKALGEGDLTARAQLERSDELGAVGGAFDRMAEQVAELVKAQQELIANVSHELRTPLARIRVALDIAEEGDATAARESLGDITEDLAELERLVSDVLQSARLDLENGRARSALPALRREPIDVRELFDKSVSRLRAAHPKRDVDASCAAGLPPIRGDFVLLRRALDNLLDNAAAYSPEGTTIHARALLDGDTLVLSVRDHGIGIAPEHVPLVTRPFFRADPSRTRRTGGIGLGLSLTSRIAAAHDGELRIESRLGEGTTIALRLPVQV